MLVQHLGDFWVVDIELVPLASTVIGLGLNKVGMWGEGFQLLVPVLQKISRIEMFKLWSTWRMIGNDKVDYSF